MQGFDRCVAPALQPVQNRTEYQVTAATGRLLETGPPPVFGKEPAGRIHVRFSASFFPGKHQIDSVVGS
jgi:hypothetical protein